MPTTTAPLGWLARPHAKAAAVTFAVLFAVGFVPLFGGPGYEHALATGLFVPSAAAISTALWIARRTLDAAHGDGLPALDPSPSLLSRSLLRGVLVGLAFASLSFATALLHGLRVGMCDAPGALLEFALTAGMGSVLGGAWGAVAGELTVWLAHRRARRGSRVRLRALAISLSVLGPVLGVVVSVYRFVTSPMIFAFDPFVGYFSGTLYDTVIDPGTALLTYRLGSLATLAALALFASVLRYEPSARFSLLVSHGTATANARLALGVLALGASLGTLAFGARLHHWSTAASITRALGAEKHGTRCDVVYPSTTGEAQADLLVKDCDEQLTAVEARLGVQGTERVRAFFFRDEEDKKVLMGAARTYIAKPWRHEVYLQLASYPHPVLGHELAHVVAGSFGRGPFRIAGSMFGLVPNPGLIEGVAVFASPSDDELSGAEWAAAMLRLGILPPMQSVFSLDFLGASSAKSYTLAGAFIEWLAQTRGVALVRAWYGGGSLEELTGATFSELDAGFRAYVGDLPLGPEVLSFAKARFERPGVFGRTCPHVVDALRAEADLCRDTQRYEEALRLYREVLAKDASDFSSRTSIATIERRHGDREAGARALREMVQDTRVPRPYRDRAEEALADANFLDGAFQDAAATYTALADLSLDADDVRRLRVKAVGATDPAARPAVAALLLGDARHPPDLFEGGVELGRWFESEGSPLSAYLVGRNLAARGRYEAAAGFLDRAVGQLSELGSPAVAREAVRQRAIVACALSDGAEVASLGARLSAWTEPGGPLDTKGAGHAARTRSLLDRCAVFAPR